MVREKCTKRKRARIDLEMWKATPGTKFLSEVYKKFRFFLANFRSDCLSLDR